MSTVNGPSPNVSFIQRFHSITPIHQYIVVWENETLKDLNKQYLIHYTQQMKVIVSFRYGNHAFKMIGLNQVSHKLCCALVLLLLS